MKIYKIEISNWRSIKSLTLEARDLMIIIGQNNHGKSNLLSSILFFFGELKHQDLDFNDGATELYVEIQFSDLDDDDKTTFKKYLTSENKIVVRKTADIGGSFRYQGYKETPVDERLREENAGAYTKRDMAESMPFHPYIPKKGRITKQDIIEAQTQYIRNSDDVEFSFEIEETNFLGLKSVAKGIFGEVFFIPAVKEVTDDFSSKETSAFGKIYSEVISAMSEDNTEWKTVREKVSNLFATLNKIDHEGNKNDNRPQQLIALEESITNELLSWGAKIDIEITPPDIDSVFKANTQVWVDDGVRTDIKRKGHGLQRALIVALVQVIANRSGCETTTESTGRKASSSRYFIFEEPELYLHPQAQRTLFDSLVALSEDNSQVVLCTHSSALIDIERYQSIYIVTKKDERAGTKVKQCFESIFEDDEKKNLNLTYWVNPDRGELFFARKVVLVEGQTDKTVIPYLAKELGVFNHEYTLIDCAAKGSIPTYIRLLNCFEIPYIAVYDRDNHSGKSAQDIEVANKSSAAIEEVLESNIGKSIIFENDVEQEIGLPDSVRKNKPYNALKHITASGFQITESLKSKIIQIYSN
ncbi:MAG: AAA family ATPase [Sphaerospermopsis sp. SIO1G2]|nr:AAA family ATPase [Sphaerospermopsis sp. SIO1G2]